MVGVLERNTDGDWAGTVKLLDGRIFPVEMAGIGGTATCPKFYNVFSNGKIVGHLGVTTNKRHWVGRIAGAPVATSGGIEDHENLVSWRLIINQQVEEIP
jgi:hypothetical protein